MFVQGATLFARKVTRSSFLECGCMCHVGGRRLLFHFSKEVSMVTMHSAKFAAKISDIKRMNNSGLKALLAKVRLSIVFCNLHSLTMSNIQSKQSPGASGRRYRKKDGH